MQPEEGMDLEEHIERSISGLREALSRLARGRTVFMGIGNTLRGDDGIGPELVARLSREGLLTVDAGTVPENHIRSVCRLKPDTVVIVDAVHLDAKPGSVELLDRSGIQGSTGFTTHSLSPALVMERLETETGADVYLMGIQPGTVEFGAPLSSSVASMLDVLPDVLRRLAGSSSRSSG